MFIVGLKPIILPALFTYGEPRETELGTAKDVYLFITIFWIPLIPVRIKSSIYQLSKDKMYRRHVPMLGDLINKLLSLAIIAFIIFATVIIFEDSGYEIDRVRRIR